MRIRDPGGGMETGRIRDPRWKKVGSRIRDKHPGSATLSKSIRYLNKKNSQTVLIEYPYTAMGVADMVSMYLRSAILD
jgi:hypothetical protein